MPVDEPLYPVNLRLAGRPCLVVGGGTVALDKIRGLVDAGAVVTVVAPDVVEGVAELEGNRVTVERRAYRRGEVSGYRIAITATDDPSVNRAVFDDGEASGVLVNSADDPGNCAFLLPSRVRRGHLLVTIGTGGHSPALSKWLRRRFEVELGPEYEVLLAMLSDARDDLRRHGCSTEGRGWQTALDSGMLELIRDGRIDEAKERLTTCLSSS